MGPVHTARFQIGDWHRLALHPAGHAGRIGQSEGYATTAGDGCFLGDHRGVFLSGCDDERAWLTGQEKRMPMSSALKRAESSTAT